MKKWMRFIVDLTDKIYHNSFLRVAFYLCIIAALVLLYLFTDGQKIEFVYNDF